MAVGKMRFAPSVTTEGVIVTLTQERRGLFGRSNKAIPRAEWPDFDGFSILSGVAQLQAMVEAEDGRAWALPDGSGYVVAHRAVAALTETEAHGLGLPPAVPLDLRISTRSHVGTPDYAVHATWMGSGGRPQFSSRIGAILEVGQVAYRIPERLFAILEAIEAVNSAVSVGQDEKLAALAALRTLLPDSSGTGIEIEPVLGDLRLSHATAFSLRIEARLDDLDLSPILFGRHVAERASDGLVVEETDGLLPPILDESFQAQFTKADFARATYVLERGTYVFVDPALRPALEVVRRVQRGTSDERRAFARNPQAFLKDALLPSGAAAENELAQAELDAAVDRLFVETRQFSERVTGFGLWVPPSLPHMERVANEWRPEEFAFRIQGKIVQLAPAGLDAAISDLRTAIEEGVERVSIGGVDLKPDPGFLGTLIGHQLARPQDRSEGSVDDETPALAQGPYTLLTRENFLTLDYIARLSPREATLSASIFGLRPSTQLLPHQQLCLEWLRRAYADGWPGVLLADDMGLGKTLQSLAFLSQLRETGVARRGAPILIVAPVGLLANWQKEHALHLSVPGLGAGLICAWGTHLRAYRRRDGSDATLGQPVLDTDALADADWILTTYETLRDYQASFGPIQFAVAVFDEIQKAKNPASRLTAAVRAVNADFKIGMTGTPVENGLADLWTIMDCLTPGLLGDLRAFLHDHPTDDLSAQQRLAASLLEPIEGRAAPVLRRLKGNILTGLPKKTPMARLSPMPAVQAECYAEFANDLQAGRIPMLSALHGFRSSSLHPWHPNQAYEEDLDEYIAASARLGILFDVLDSVAKKREKALIFLESINLQPVLAELVRRRYGLARLPLIINGQVAGAARQNAVDEFQGETTAFDVMILSPRAGGVGLTLTSANHVIHLSRWWNPAVEDQCTDRVFRIGQRRDVTVYLPLAEHPVFGDRSYDLVLDKLLDEKRTISRGVFMATEIGSAELQRRMNANEGAEADFIDATELDRMEPLAFEAWFGRQARKAKLEVQLTPRTGDGGADLIFRHPGGKRTALIQCKHRADPNSPMDERALDDLDRAMHAYGKPDALRVAVTNAVRFTQVARERANRTQVMLLTRDSLQQGLRDLVSALSLPST